mgnify:CR=1 FL=1
MKLKQFWLRFRISQTIFLVISFSTNKKSVSPEEVASEFKISKESAIFVLGKLAQKGKINIDGNTSA